MINNFAFNPNPRIHKTNLVMNCNSTGNVKRINTNFNILSRIHLV